MIILVANHFEPSWNEQCVALDWDTQLVRVDEWVKLARVIGGAVRDHDGSRFRHTYFYPAEQYNARLLDRIAGLQAEGLGEVEVHLHHGIETPDNPENTRATLCEFRDALDGATSTELDLMCLCSPKTRDTAARTIPPSPSRSEFVPVPGDVTNVGDIVLRAFTTSVDPPTGEPLLLSRATRLVRSGHQIGRLVGVEVSPDSGALTGVFGRQHWWTRRLRLDGAGLDFSSHGEVRAGASKTRAA